MRSSAKQSRERMMPVHPLICEPSVTSPVHKDIVLTT
jgi:hypothetical protein